MTRLTGEVHPCSQCGQRIAVHRWAYVYGRTRRGVNPRTGQLDDRSLGTDTVFLCRQCERRVLRARLYELARRHPYESIFAALGLAGFLYGSSFIKTETAVAAWAAVAIGVFWVAFVWATRQPKAMCRGVFLLRRRELAEMHGVSPKDLEPYLDVAA